MAGYAEGIATTAYVVSALAAAGGAATAVDSARAGRNANRRQGQAQEQAKAAAASQAREAETAANKANRRKPDIAAILSGAQNPGSGIGSTMLTGAGGVPTASLALGRNTALGAS